MKRLLIITLLACLALPVQAFATWTLTPSVVSIAGNYMKWKVVCTSDGAGLTATNLLALDGMTDQLLREIQGETVMLLKVSPGTGGVIPDNTINITLTDGEDDALWTETTISKDAVTWHDMSDDIGAYIPIFNELNLTLNDIGTTGDQVTLYFIMWREVY